MIEAAACYCCTTWTAIVLALSIHCAGIALIAAHTTSDINFATTIIDFGFELLPEVPAGYGELLPFGLLFVNLVLMGIGRHWQQFRKFTYAAAAIMIFRTLCVTATILPASDPKCLEGDMLAVVLRGAVETRCSAGTSPT
jgi:hypothetical protein